MLLKYGIPENYKNILNEIIKSNIDYILFKHTDLVNNPIGGLDILFKNKKEYYFAKKILIKNGFIEYLGENNEPYKTMLVKNENNFLYEFEVKDKYSKARIVGSMQEFKRGDLVLEN